MLFQKMLSIQFNNREETWVQIDDEDLHCMQNAVAAHKSILYEKGARFYKTRL
jgi:hypothetical protein